MLRYFKAHPEIPNHYDAVKEPAITTSDLDDPVFRFSRIIQKNCILKYGWLAYDARTRIKIFGKHDAIEKEIAQELKSIMVDDTMTILHYSPEGYLDSVIVNIKPKTFSELPERFKELYYD